MKEQTDLIRFSDRMLIADKFVEWGIMNNVKFCPDSVIAFLQIKGWLNEEKILKELRE